MRFTRDQHTEMAERLYERAKQNPDPEKGEEAAGNGKHVPATGETGSEARREIGVRAETGDKPAPSPPVHYSQYRTTIAVPAVTNPKRVVIIQSRRKSFFILPNPPRPLQFNGCLVTFQIIASASDQQHEPDDAAADAVH